MPPNRGGAKGAASRAKSRKEREKREAEAAKKAKAEWEANSVYVPGHWSKHALAKGPGRGGLKTKYKEVWIPATRVPKKRQDVVNRKPPPTPKRACATDKKPSAACCLPARKPKINPVDRNDPPSVQEKEKSNRRFVLSYARRECCSIIFGMIFLVGGLSADLAFPYFFGQIIDAINKDEFDKIDDICINLIAVIASASICVGLRAATFNILSEKIAKNLKQDYHKSIVNTDFAFFESKRTDELVSHLNSDIQVVQDTIATNVSMLVRFVRSLFIIIAVLIVMMLSSPILTCIVFGGILTLAIFGKFYGCWIKDSQSKIEEAKVHMNRVAEEFISNVRYVKAFCSEDAQIEKFMEGDKVVYNIGARKSVPLAFLSTFSSVILYGSMICTIYVAKSDYQDGKVSLGEITSFIFYLL